MKWTNHSKLNVYGVRIVGWPENIPSQNPSTLSVAQNKTLLEMLNAGKIYFERLDGSRTPNNLQDRHSQSPRRDEEAMFEDSIDYSWTVEGDGNSLVPTVRVDLSVFVRSLSSHRVRGGSRKGRLDIRQENFPLGPGARRQSRTMADPLHQRRDASMRRSCRDIESSPPLFRLRHA